MFLSLSSAYPHQMEPLLLTLAMVILSLLLTRGDAAHWVSVW